MDETKPTSYYIWEPLFRCKVPQLQTTSKAYLKHYGMPTTGNDAYDKDLANQLIDTAIPIVKMVEYFSKGIPIYIVKSADIKTIYQHIENHLLAWKRQLDHGLNIGGAPVDDLIAMDAFANKIYDHAKFHFTREIADSIFLRQMGSINRNTFLSPVVTPVTETALNKPSEGDGYEQRGSMSEHFKEKRAGIRKWR